MIGTPDRRSLPVKARVNILAAASEKAWLAGAGPGNTAQAPLSFDGDLAAAEFWGRYRILGLCASWRSAPAEAARTLRSLLAALPARSAHGACAIISR
jgi:hypothetical protein